MTMQYGAYTLQARKLMLQTRAQNKQYNTYYLSTAKIVTR